MNRWYWSAILLATSLITCKFSWDLSRIYDPLARQPDMANLAYVLAACQPLLSLISAYLCFLGLRVLITGKLKGIYG